jgi:hypothetical protein
LGSSPIATDNEHNVSSTDDSSKDIDSIIGKRLSRHDSECTLDEETENKLRTNSNRDKHADEI